MSSLDIQSITPLQSHVTHTGGKTNKWLCGFVMMISLSAQGNYVTMAMLFPWVKDE